MTNEATDEERKMFNTKARKGVCNIGGCDNLLNFVPTKEQLNDLGYLLWCERHFNHFEYLYGELK